MVCLFWTHRDLPVSTSWVPSPILYIYEYSTHSFSLSSSPIYLSLKLNIFITFVCYVCILHRVQGTACESLFSLTMCIPRISLNNLYPVSRMTGLSTFLVYGLVIWIFNEVEKIMYFLWTWNYVLSGHRILKEGVMSINKVIKRDSWEAKLRPGNWSMSMRKLRLLKDLVYYIGRGNYRDFDQKEMFLDL